MLKTKTNTVDRLIKSFIFLISVAGFVLLQGCSSDDPATPPATDASGIYTGGTASIDGTGVTDFTAIIYNDRLMMFSGTLNVLYDGTITENADGSFTSTVDVYQNGVNTTSTGNMSGTINNRSQVTGTITGAGVANASFTLVFNDLYDRAATLPRIVTDSVSPLWEGVSSFTGGILNDYIKMDFLTTNVLSAEFGSSSLFLNCKSSNGVFALGSQANIYVMATDVINLKGCGIVGTNYTGFATVIDNDPATPNTDDVLIMAITNGTNSVFGTITK